MTALDRIDVTKIDFGVGILRGVLSRTDLALVDAHELEAVIQNLRGAARIIERLQKQAPVRSKSRSSRRKPVSSGSRRDTARCRP